MLSVYGKAAREVVANWRALRGQGPDAGCPARPRAPPLLLALGHSVADAASLS